MRYATKTVDDWLIILYTLATRGSAAYRFTNYQNNQFLKLAKYDISPVRSLSGQAINGHPFTSKQKEFAVKLITKYHKQIKQLTNGELNAQTVSVDTPTRLPLRQLTPTNKEIDIIAIDNEHYITVGFPYNNTYIERMHALARKLPGLDYDKKLKKWKVKLNVFNFESIIRVKFLTPFAKTPAFNDVLDEYNALKNTTPIVYLDSDKLRISPMPSQLASYMDETFGLSVSQHKYIELTDATLTLVALLQHKCRYRLSDDVINLIMDRFSRKTAMLLVCGLAAVDFDINSSPERTYDDFISNEPFNELRQILSKQFNVEFVDIVANAGSVFANWALFSKKLLVNAQSYSHIAVNNEKLCYISTTVLPNNAENYNTAIPINNISSCATIVVYDERTTRPNMKKKITTIIKRYDSYLNYKRRSKSENNRA